MGVVGGLFVVATFVLFLFLFPFFFLLLEFLVWTLRLVKIVDGVVVCVKDVVVANIVVKSSKFSSIFWERKDHLTFKQNPFYTNYLKVSFFNKLSGVIYTNLRGWGKSKYTIVFLTNLIAWDYIFGFWSTFPCPVLAWFSFWILFLFRLAFARLCIGIWVG